MGNQASAASAEDRPVPSWTAMLVDNPSKEAIQEHVLSGQRSDGRKICPRVEIDEFVQNEDMFNLFILALLRLQVNTEDNLKSPWSWFGLGRIHGAVNAPWEGVEKNALYTSLLATGSESQFRTWSIVDSVPTITASKTGPDYAYGYCSHGSVLFPTWHRAYSMATEQAIQAQMFEIADIYADEAEKTKTQELAKRFRLPFWNPFQARTTSTGKVDGDLITGLSVLFCVSKIYVKVPNSTTYSTMVNNPLYAYEYPTKAELAKAFPEAEGGWVEKFFTTTRNKPLEAFTVRCGVITQPWSDHTKMQSYLTTRMRPDSTWDPGMNYNDWDPSTTTYADWNKDSRGNLNTAGLRAKLYACLTSTDSDPEVLPFTYAKFATRSFLDSVQRANPDAPYNKPWVRARLGEPRSVESWHDGLHNICAGASWGGYGSMNPNDYAGFDPIFPFIHTFVDFITALYQAKFPNNGKLFSDRPALAKLLPNDLTADALNARNGWWNSAPGYKGDIGILMATIDPTYTSNVGTWENSLTPLTPFKIDRNYDGAAVNRKDERQFWTSLDCEDISRLGYTYDELIPMPTAAEIASQPIESGNIILANMNYANSYINKNFAWFQPIDDTGRVEDPSFSKKVAEAIPRLNHLNIFTEKPPKIDLPIATLSGTPTPTPVTLNTLYATGTTGFADLWGTPPAEEQKSSEEEKSPEEKFVGARNLSMVEKLATATNQDPPAITLKGRSDTERAVESGQHHLGSHLRSQSEDLKTSPSSHVDSGGIGLNGITSPHLKNNGTTAHDPDDLVYDYPPSILKDGTLRNWSFQYRCQRHALNTSFSVYVFIGDFPADQTKWNEAYNLVLVNHTMVTHNENLIGPYSGEGDNPNLTPAGTGSASSCGRCNTQAAKKLITTDFTPLTPMLMHYVLSGRKASNLVPESEARLRSLDRVDVIPFLKRHLHWRIVRLDRVEIHRNDVPDFKSWVHDEIMTLPKRMHHPPKYDGHEIQWDITHGRPGGLDQGEGPFDFVLNNTS